MKLSQTLSFGFLMGAIASGSTLLAESDFPRAKISPQTIAFFKEGQKTCKLKFESYIISLEEEIVSRGDLHMAPPSDVTRTLARTFGCDEKFVADFNKKIANDNVEYHRAKRELIKKEIEEFEDRGLTGNFKLNQYMNYAQENMVDIGDDEEINKYYAKKKGDAEKRKATCSDVNNIKDPLSLEEPRSQDSIGWCYAYTASDLLSHALGKKVSAVHAASIYNDKLTNIIMMRKEGGFTDDTVNALIKSGVCLEKDLPSEDYKFSWDLGGNISSLFKEVQSLALKYTPRASTKAAPDKKPEEAQKRYKKQQVYEDLCFENQETLVRISEVFPQLTLDQLTEILMRSGSNAFQELAKTCPVDKDPELKNLVVKTDGSKKTIYKTMDEQLDKGNIVGIGYKAEVLENYKNNESWFANHASSIVGRRFNEMTLSCEYMIRNTWGNDCSSYNWDDYECKDGHVWIGEDFLKYNNAITEVQYVEKKK